MSKLRGFIERMSVDGEISNCFIRLLKKQNTSPENLAVLNVSMRPLARAIWTNDESAVRNEFLSATSWLETMFKEKKLTWSRLIGAAIETIRTCSHCGLISETSLDPNWFIAVSPAWLPGTEGSLQDAILYRETDCHRPTNDPCPDCDALRARGRRTRQNQRSSFRK